MWKVFFKSKLIGMMNIHFLNFEVTERDTVRDTEGLADWWLMNGLFSCNIINFMCINMFKDRNLRFESEEILLPCSYKFCVIFYFFNFARSIETVIDNN